MNLHVVTIFQPWPFIHHAAHHACAACAVKPAVSSLLAAGGMGNFLSAPCRLTCIVCLA